MKGSFFILVIALILMLSSCASFSSRSPIGSGPIGGNPGSGKDTEKIDITKASLEYEQYKDESLARWQYRVIGIGTYESKELTIPETYLHTEIRCVGKGAFSRLDIISLKTSHVLTHIEEDAFRGCASLAVIELGKKTKYIGDGAFAKCVSLSRVEFPASVTAVGVSAFEGCSSLEEVIFNGGSSLTIGDHAFKDTALRRIALPTSVSAIGDNIFSGCKYLEEVVINDPDYATDPYLFDGCSSLRRISFAGTRERWELLVEEHGKGHSHPWYEACPNVDVICSDGVITYSGVTWPDTASGSEG